MVINLIETGAQFIRVDVPQKNQALHNLLAICTKDRSSSLHFYGLTLLVCLAKTGISLSLPRVLTRMETFISLV